MTTLTTKAYAKINLFLRVTGKREDGYHEIESVMQSVSLADTVTVSVDTDVRGLSVSLTCTDENIPTDRRNIAVKCAYAFFGRFGIENCAAEIHIEKKIPVSGGLAGGSTDGAAVLKLLNELYGTNADTETLCEIGASVGADIPFCIIGGTALCRGIGDIITPVRRAGCGCHVLLVSPGGGVSTPEAYRLIDEHGSVPLSATIDGLIGELENGVIPRSLHNDFEAVILPRNERATFVKQMLTDSGAESVQMSGSGPTVFGMFDSEEKCLSAAEKAKENGFKAYVCHII